MDQILNLDPAGLGIVVLRTTVVYAVLLIGLRIAGKREIGQMTPFDLVVLLVVSNAVQNAMVGPDTTLTAGLVAALTLLLVNAAVDRVGLRYAWLRREVVGTPTLLVHEGRLLDGNVRREGLASADVLQALREHGVGSLREVKTAVLEVDGTISVIPVTASASRTRRRVRGRKPAP